MLNLIKDAWIPVKRKDGQQQLICPYQIVEESIITIDSPRSDFNGAIVQFLVGLVQRIAAPKNTEDWVRALINPLLASDLQVKFASLAYAFNLAGDGPRFMQDLNLETELNAELAQLAEKEVKKKLADRYISIDNLLIDGVAEYFNKPGTINRLCPACAAMALLTLQTNAPSGGRGHRTSLRGGGPLTTLVLGNNLWETIWLNILPKDKFLNLYNNKAEIEEKYADLKYTFPWLTATRTSEAGQIVLPENTHLAQMFWGMPRRIRLDFTNLESGICDIDQTISDQLVTRYTTKSYGINYGEGWLHTLTPHYQDKIGPPKPVHGQPGGISYRHWLGLVQSSDERQRAKAIEHFIQEQGNYMEFNSLFKHPARLWVFGYDMDNMKPRAWVDSTMPIISVKPEQQLEYEDLIAQLINVAAKIIAPNTRKYIKNALFKRPSDVKGDLSFIDTEFWQRTESKFYQTLQDLRNDLSQDLFLKKRWLKILCEASLNLFDEIVQMGDFQDVDLKRIVKARHDLELFNSPTNKNIILILNLPKENKQKAQ